MRVDPEVEASLVDIFAWTLDRFGPRQAEAYEADLIDAFGRIAEDALIGRSCRKVWGERMPERQMFARVGAHVVVWEEVAEEVVVVAVLHGAMDLPRRLGE
nr:type II toxin-antitoxin system RelE/ParE family toxin [Rubellimicrobium aerolatum]